MSSRRLIPPPLVVTGVVFGFESNSNKFIRFPSPVEGFPSSYIRFPVSFFTSSSSSSLFFFLSFFFFFFPSSLSLDSSSFFPDPIPANRALAFSIFLVSCFAGYVGPNLFWPGLFKESSSVLLTARVSGAFYSGTVGVGPVGCGIGWPQIFLLFDFTCKFSSWFPDIYSY